MSDADGSSTSASEDGAPQLTQQERQKEYKQRTRLLKTKASGMHKTFPAANIFMGYQGQQSIQVHYAFHGPELGNNGSLQNDIADVVEKGIQSTSNGMVKRLASKGIIRAVGSDQKQLFAFIEAARQEGLVADMQVEQLQVLAIRIVNQRGTYSCSGMLVLLTCLCKKIA